MFSRMFGRSRRPSSLSAARKDREENDYVIVDAAGGQFPPSATDAQSMYSLEGASAFLDSAGNSRRSSEVHRALSADEPLSGVPFKLTVCVSEERGGADLAEALAVTAKMEATDWDAYEYDFRLEQGILDECNS